MPSRISCSCLLCSTEADLRKLLQMKERDNTEDVFSRYPRLRTFVSSEALLRHLRSAPPESVDGIFEDLVAARKVQPHSIESLLILAFLPMLHATIRRVTSVQSALTAEDVAQQVLSFFLEVLSSAALAARHSHFAFSISRSVKRKAFLWANRQGALERFEVLRGNAEDGLALSAESFERQAALRHFLNAAVARHLLTEDELDLLVEFKLEGNGGADFEASGRGNCNMLRQRLKRLLAKLRRLAEPPPNRQRTPASDDTLSRSRAE